MCPAEVNETAFIEMLVKAGSRIIQQGDQNF